ARCWLSGCIIFFFFFFSSRRRHTRWPRDWSSDVCSSDLGTWRAMSPAAEVAQLAKDLTSELAQAAEANKQLRADLDAAVTALRRSEERRVGKECRSRGGQYQ